MDLSSYVKTCQEHLAPSDDAQQYLAQRGITDTAIEEWSLGYDPTGVIKPMKERIILPLFDYHNKIISVTGRTIVNQYNDPKYLHLPFHKSRWLYGLHLSALLGKPPIVVEGHFSAIKLHQIGWPGYAVMGSSLSRWQAGHLVYLAAYSGQTEPYNFILFPDNDKPELAKQWRNQLKGVAAIHCRVGNYGPLCPSDCDPDWLISNQQKNIIEQLEAAAKAPKSRRLRNANMQLLWGGM